MRREKNGGKNEDRNERNEKRNRVGRKRLWCLRDAASGNAAERWFIF